MDRILESESVKELNELLLGNPNVKLRDRILLSPYTKFLLPSLVIAFVLPVTVYAIMVSGYVVDSSFSLATCNIRTEYYVDCLPGKSSPTESDCMEVLCCWNDTLGFCYHYVPAQHGYTPSGGVYYQGVTLVPRETNSPLGSANAEEVFVDISAVDSNHVEITLSTSSQSSSNSRRRRGVEPLLHRWSGSGDEVNGEEDELSRNLLSFLPRDGRRRTVEVQLDESSNLTAYVHYPEFSVTVARGDFTLNETSSIFSTALGPLILTETYWEWTLYLSNGALYGLDDLELNGTTNSIYNNENGSITPAFLAINPTGEAAAYYVDYKGPMEIQVLNKTNLVILRGLALPESLGVHVFAGPTPLEAVQQLTSSMSSNSSWSMPPLYNYGLHVCPTETLSSVVDAVSNLNETIEVLASAGAPWDSHCIHEQLVSTMNSLLASSDFDAISEATSLLEAEGRNFNPHLSPMVLADEGTLHSALEDAALLLTNGTTSYLGQYQDASVVYPDWTSDEVATITAAYLVDYLNNTGSPGTLWLRDTWPKDETNTSSRTEAEFTSFDYMPEAIEYSMNNFTVPFDLETVDGFSHYATHNGYSEGFRTFVKSSVPTIEFLGPPGEAANTSWSGLRRAVRSAIGAGLGGHLPPPVYVCGTEPFNATLHDQLCIRWYQAAIAWPHVLVVPDRLPGGSYLSASASLNVVKALRIRASLATYQHTVVASHFQRSSPVLVPTSFYFPEDTSTTHKWDQFMWGEALLVGLVTLPGVSQVSMRLPGDVSWRHLLGGAEAASVTNGTVPITATMGDLIILVRPGYIVAIHEDVSNTTLVTMASNVTLAVNLECANEDCSASGEIWYGVDDGEYLSLGVNSTHLVLGNVNGVQNYACNADDNSTTVQSTFIETVQILGNSSYQVQTELCDLQDNVFSISLV
ncbi:lysosomal alpha-glucosidase-like [Neodiprion fabricii]|uniref:lysosomal alpha-glucosidase-like n=1 Tax=Neodiprion fabricii TaxID=2872261 RepID=UPI001ED8D46A|nr:lysosomal alpha-glucosidase-like [Neodiprion fabricii]